MSIRNGIEETTIIDLKMELKDGTERLLEALDTAEDGHAGPELGNLYLDTSTIGESQVVKERAEDLLKIVGKIRDEAALAIRGNSKIDPEITAILEAEEEAGE